MPAASSSPRFGRNVARPPDNRPRFSASAAAQSPCPPTCESVPNLIDPRGEPTPWDRFATNHSLLRIVACSPQSGPTILPGDQKAPQRCCGAFGAAVILGLVRLPAQKGRNVEEVVLCAGARPLLGFERCQARRRSGSGTGRLRRRLRPLLRRRRTDAGA